MKFKKLKYAPNHQNGKEEEKFHGTHVLEKDKNTVRDSSSREPKTVYIHLNIAIVEMTHYGVSHSTNSLALIVNSE